MFDQSKLSQIDFISLQFSDLMGVPKEIIIPSGSLENAVQNGVWFDGSSIEGFARIQEDDLFLKPDINTYAPIPWLNNGGKTARVICDIYNADGTPFESDPRYILRKMTAEAAEAGYLFNVGPELEFYLFQNEIASRIMTIDYSSYFDSSSNAGFTVIREVLAALKTFEIIVESTHHEVGKGQYEIDFRHGDALDSADKVMTLKYTVKKIAQMNGMHATFMAKPISGMAGSGMHIHQSIFDVKTNKNLFYEEDDKYNLSRLAYNFIAGQIKHIKAMSAILCPTINSYKRLITGFEAPVYLTWAGSNRTALIRVPKSYNQKNTSTRIELRCPDPTCNPYLAFAVMLKAGLDGIKNNLEPPKPVEEFIYSFDQEMLIKKNIDVLPTNLNEAINNMKKSYIIKNVLGEKLFDKYISIKNSETEDYLHQVTPWELDHYMEMF